MKRRVEDIRADAKTVRRERDAAMRLANERTRNMAPVHEKAAEDRRRLGLALNAARTWRSFCDDALSQRDEARAELAAVREAAVPEYDYLRRVVTLARAEPALPAESVLFQAGVPGRVGAREILAALVAGDPTDSDSGPCSGCGEPRPCDGHGPASEIAANVVPSIEERVAKLEVAVQGVWPTWRPR